MKFFNQFFVCLALVCFFSSCEKQADLELNQKITSNNGKLKSYTEETKMSGAYQFNTIRLYYDASGRLTKMLSENTDEKFMYKYNNTFYTTEFYQADKLVNQHTSFLTASLLIDSTVQPYDEAGVLTEKYIYNKSGQLSRVNVYYNKKSTGPALYNSRVYSYDDYGNLIREANNYSVTTYSYYNQLTSNVFISAPYVQKPKNLVKTTTRVSGGITETFNHTYTFDKNNKLIAEKITKPGTSDVIERKFSYYQ